MIIVVSNIWNLVENFCNLKTVEKCILHTKLIFCTFQNSILYIKLKKKTILCMQIIAFSLAQTLNNLILQINLSVYRLSFTLKLPFLVL